MWQRKFGMDVVEVGDLFTFSTTCLLFIEIFLWPASAAEQKFYRDNMIIQFDVKNAFTHTNQLQSTPVLILILLNCHTSCILPGRYE